jgi:hypothetical protein
LTLKKTFLTAIISVGVATTTLAQGTVVFENVDSSGGGSISIFNFNGNGGYLAALPGTYTLALLWAPGSSIGAVVQSSFSQIGTYTERTSNFGGGFFTDSSVLTTGAATAGGSVAVFEVEGWSGSYANYAAAVAAGAYVGQTAPFLNGTGNPTPPATPPVNTTGWDGDIILTLAPEPGTMAICALGAAALCLFYQRK